MKFCTFFLFLWFIFALLDPDRDPATQINADPCGSGSATLPIHHALRPKVPYFLHNCNNLHEVDFFFHWKSAGDRNYSTYKLREKKGKFSNRKNQKFLTLAKEAGLNMSSMILNCQSSGVRVVRAYMYRINSC